MNFLKWMRNVFQAKEPPSFEETIIQKYESMAPSDKCYDLIKHYESCRLKAYRDSAGVWTIGWGTISYENGSPVKEGDIIPQFKADQLLKYEINKKAQGVESRTLKINLKQCQFDALVSFSYNLGLGALSQSTLLKKIKINPSDPFIDSCFLMWDKAKDKNTGKLVVLEGLKARRKSESYLYFNDEVRFFN